MASIFDWSVTAGSNDTADTDITWVEGQLGQTVNNSARAMMAKVAAMANALKGAYTTTNIVNAYSVTVDFPPSALSKGFFGIIRFNAANTGASTLQVNALSAANLKNGVGTALASGEIVANGLYLVAYDTVAAEYRIVSKVTSGASGLLTASGYTASATNKLFGRSTAGAGAVEEISLAADHVFTAGVMGLVAFTGDVTKAAAGTALTIAAGVVTNAQLANVNTATFKGRNTGGTGSPEDMTATQATANLNVMAASLKGLAPAPSGSPVSTKYLSEAGTYVTVPTGSAWTLIETLNPSGVASTQNTVSLSGYRMIRITLNAMVPATTAVNLNMQTSIDGSTFINWSTCTYNQLQAANTVGSAVAGLLNGASGLITNTAAAGGLSGTIILYQYNQAARGFGVFDTVTAETGSFTITRYSGAMQSSVSTARTHVKFLFSSGNIASGTVVIEGMA